MDKIPYYQAQVTFHFEKAEFFRKREGYFSFLRLISFVGLAYLVVQLFFKSEFLGIIFIFPAIAIFGFILNFHLKTTKNKLKHEYLSEINNSEIECLKGNYSQFADGGLYNEKDHAYLNDLDIFGKHTLFQYINRTSTEPGSQLLANWLKAPAPFEDIEKRQNAIRELADKFGWRQELRSEFYANPTCNQNPKPIIDWCKHESELKNSKGLYYLTHIQSFLSVVLIILTFYGLPQIWLILCLLLNMGINYKYIKRINSIQSSLSKSFELLQSYHRLIKLIEGEVFESEKLLILKDQLTGNKPVSQKIKNLSLLAKKLDYRLNILIGIPLNLLFFWDIKQCLKLEKWKNENKGQIDNWFQVMAEFEVLSSFATLNFNQPQWTFPVVENSYFVLEASEAGHPLIITDKRITNNFAINNKGKIALITGSNMSGKSTFLRTVGVNMVLALAGAPVCAKAFRASYVKIYSSMRISDSLEDNTSSFYAELKKLANIIQVVEKKERVLLLLDEILRGTNSNDRHTGSVALIRQLIKNDAPALLATHDLGLSQLTDEFPDKLDIYNFDVKIQGEELYFDYQINKGICKSLNASILMKKMGIEV